MLVLTRTTGKRIVINENIYITVLAAAHGKARIGIEAPSDVTIHREEIHDLIHGKDTDEDE